MAYLSLLFSLELLNSNLTAAKRKSHVREEASPKLYLFSTTEDCVVWCPALDLQCNRILGFLQSRNQTLYIELSYKSACLEREAFSKFMLPPAQRNWPAR